MIKLRVFEKGELIIKENEVAETAFSIESGRVEVFLNRKGKKISLQTLGVGDSVGEMSMIDDKPHSASVRALEKTVVKEISQEFFNKSLEPASEFVKNILKGLFQRLRHANYLIARYEEALTHSEISTITPIENSVPKVLLASNIKKPGRLKVPLVSIEGLTPEAQESLAGQQQSFQNFPIRIGRVSGDPMTFNHVNIEDTKPYRISRNHLSILLEDEQPAVIDSGSHLGTIVNNIKMGGGESLSRPVLLKPGKNTLVLGDETSIYKYVLTVS